ncbi:glycosyltransferase [Acidithiobacillus ferriphilus]|uniref:glycosyltransferase family 2 protein n=1 Tax=Acidithiobacillus ferriphilus TaxID=1689834 RepID=UPI001C063971|nr:glycosyltransferase family 2 protein [Acidithiobacillus ferriphilus]MBU2786485.1 glycosyltransferase [Acidithiobacillus ferriphilus]
MSVSGSSPVVMIVPCKNEGFLARSTMSVIHSLLQAPGEDKPNRVIVVFDGGMDVVPPAGLDPRIRLVPLEDNRRGKAGACLAAIREMPDLKNPLVLLWDCDSEYDFGALGKMVAAARANPEAMVIGKRQGKMLWRSIYANAVIRMALWRSTGRKPPTDVLTGSRCCARSVVVEGMAFASGFDMETRITRLCLEREIPMLEVAVPYHPRTKGKKIRARDLFTLLKAATCQVAGIQLEEKMVP